MKSKKSNLEELMSRIKKARAIGEMTSKPEFIEPINAAMKEFASLIIKQEDRLTGAETCIEYKVEVLRENEREFLAYDKEKNTILLVRKTNYHL